MENKYSGLTPEEKYALLTEDFLERDGDRFVRIRRTGRLGWEDTLPADSAYSAAILNPKSDKDLLLNACRLARQMITAMDTPFKVQVRIDSTRSCTDSRTVHVATKVFDEVSMPLGKRLDTFLGLAVHEGSHLLYTDFGVLDGNGNRTVHMLENIIEDEMIERKLGERKPGMANFLKAAKYYYFGRYEQQSGELPEDPATRLFNAILSMVRYPAALRPEDAMEFADELLLVRDILTPYPETTVEGMECAKRIHEMLKRFISDPPAGRQEPSLQGGESGLCHGQSREASEGMGPAGDRGRSKEDPTGPKGADAGAAQEDAPLAGESGGTDGTREDDPGGDIPNGGTVSDEEVDAILSAILSATDVLTGDPASPGENPLDESDLCEAAKKDRHLIARECDGDLEAGILRGDVILREQPDAESYRASAARVRRHVAATAAALRCNGTSYAYSLTGMRNGILDPNKIAEARQGVPTVYMKKGEVRSDPVNVVLVIDESGSMHGVREQLARDTAVLINEAVGSVPAIGLYIYGYSTGPDGNEIIAYREGNLPFDRNTLGSITSRCGTPTAPAVAEAAARVRRCSSDRTLMFVLSDGGAEGGPKGVRAAVDRIRKDGFSVIGVSISSSLDESVLRQMYDSWIVMEDLQGLASSLAKTIKAAVMKTSKRRSA